MKRIRKITVFVVLGVLLVSFAVFPPVVLGNGVTVTVTLSGGNHTVALGAIVFTRHSEEGKVIMDHEAFNDPTYEKFKCGPGESKSMTFNVPKVPNDLEIIYISDGGAQTPYTIPTHRFRFGKQYSLPSPSPGVRQEPPPGDPPGDATISVMLNPEGETPRLYNPRQFCPVPQNRLRARNEDVETVTEAVEKLERSDLTEEQREMLKEVTEKLQQAVELIDEATDFLEAGNCIPANSKLLEAEKLLLECKRILSDLPDP